MRNGYCDAGTFGVAPGCAIIGTLISLTLFQSADIRRIGEIPVGLSPLQLPTFSPDYLALMLVDGVMLGCIDTPDGGCKRSLNSHRTQV